MKIITLTDDGFLPGTIALFESIRINGNLDHPGFNVLTPCLSDSNRTLLLRLFPGTRIYDVDAIVNSHDLPFNRVSKGKRKRLNKLAMFALDEPKMLYLDSDMICLRPLNSLSLETTFAACLNLGGKVHETVNSRPMFNSGLMLFSPSRNLFQEILIKLNTFEFTTEYADQFFLNCFFSSRPGGVTYLGQEYNLTISSKVHLRPVWDHFVKDVVNLHYTTFLPWKVSGLSKAKCMLRFRNENNLWWRYFRSAYVR